MLNNKRFSLALASLAVIGMLSAYPEKGYAGTSLCQYLLGSAQDSCLTAFDYSPAGDSDSNCWMTRASWGTQYATVVDNPTPRQQEILENYRSVAEESCPCKIEFSCDAFVHKDSQQETRYYTCTDITLSEIRTLNENNGDVRHPKCS